MVHRRSKKIWNLRNVIKIGSNIVARFGTRADVRDDYIEYRTETINNHDRIMGTIAQRLEDLTKK